MLVIYLVNTANIIYTIKPKRDAYRHHNKYLFILNAGVFDLNALIPVSYFIWFPLSVIFHAPQNFRYIAFIMLSYVALNMHTFYRAGILFVFIPLAIVCRILGLPVTLKWKHSLNVGKYESVENSISSSLHDM